MMLHAIYSSLERALSEHSTDPLLCNVYNPALLARAPSLDGDCSHYTGERDWKGTVGANALKMEDPKALRDYVGRLDALGTEEGGANKLLAHAYVRYRTYLSRPSRPTLMTRMTVGDLSGGQVIAKTIRKAYALPSTGEGSAFYEFYLPPPSLSTPASDDRSTVPTSSSTIPQRAGPTETKAIKTWLKAGIDEAGRRMTEDERLEVLEEARRAFQLNIDIFSSFEGMVTKSEVEVGKKEQREVPTGVQETGLGRYVGVGVLLLLVLYLLVRENEALLA
jgi:heme oxygenase